MPLFGSAFIAMWHDIEPQARDEYLHWHSVEHMPERVGIPGFLAGRRYVSYSDTAYRYFTMYEGEEVSTFTSAPYQERLNSPSTWTTSLQPYFQNFVRLACRTEFSRGFGVAQSLATLWLADLPAEPATFGATVEQLADKIAEQSSLTACHLGWVEREASRSETKERELRPDMPEVDFDAVVLLEGVSKSDVDAARQALQRELEIAGATVKNNEAYALSYYLIPNEESA